MVVALSDGLGDPPESVRRRNGCAVGEEQFDDV